MGKNYSFYIEYYSKELKQHINLSEPTWLIISDDIKNFYNSNKSESFSGFLNTVFKNFYQQAEASIELRTIEKKESLEKLYSSREFSSFDKKTISLFIEKYANVYEADLKDKALSYPNGHGEKFRINKENLNLLRDSLEAANYGGSIGLYLKAIYEEYATKPTYLREQIFFHDTVDTIHKAINEHKKLKLTLHERLTTSGFKRPARKYYLSPYRIVQDKTNTFNYVIGYSEEIVDQLETDENGKTRKTSYSKEKRPACFRISRIEKCDIQISMGAKISNEHVSELEKMLVDRGAMFMSSDPIDIKIRFTSKGLESFKHQLYMRPQFYSIDKEDKYIYNFRCTEIQAINYFFKFGWDANIIEPTELAEKFKIRYERALKSYKGMTKEEIFASETDS